VTVFTIVALLPCGPLVRNARAAEQGRQSVRQTSRSFDADRPRQIVMHLGVGGHIVAVLHSGRKLKGKIQVIGVDRFVMALDGNGTLAEIFFHHVRRITPVRPRQSIARQAIEGAVVLIGALVLFPRLAKE
jgi:hypothetical protein